jgi:hypothetical protein
MESLKLPLVSVKWQDSYAEHGWESLDSLVMKIATVQSIGYVLKEDKISITLVQSTSDTGAYDHIITIPKGCIIERRKVK